MDEIPCPGQAPICIQDLVTAFPGRQVAEHHQHGVQLQLAADLQRTAGGIPGAILFQAALQAEFEMLEPAVIESPAVFQFKIGRLHVGAADVPGLDGGVLFDAVEIETPVQAGVDLTSHSKEMQSIVAIRPIIVEGED